MRKMPPAPDGAATFPVPLYGGRILLCITRDSYAEALEQLKDDPYDHIKEVSGVSSKHAELDSRAVYLVGVFEGGQKTLVHELAHTTFSILAHSSVPVNARNDEAFAYLMDSLFALCVDAMKEIRRRRKRG